MAARAVPVAILRGPRKERGAPQDEVKDFEGWLSVRWHLKPAGRIYRAMGKDFDPADYSVVLKHRAPLPNPWRWEIYRAGRSSPVQWSSIYFSSMVMAKKAGKEALTRLLDKLSV